MKILIISVLVLVMGFGANGPTQGVPLANPRTPPNVDISGDDNADRYVGTGGLILPGTVAQSTRREVAGCTDCHWRLTEPCNGVFSDGCIIILHACEGADEELLRAWLSTDGGATWRNRGLICVGSGGPVTVAAAAIAITDNFERIMPPSRISYQPGRGVLPYLPVIFQSGQPQSVPASSYTVAGQRVVLSPVARWAWDFGDGANLDTSIAGSTYPDTAVAHGYSRDGTYQVAVTTIWAATFTIDGLGPFPVAAQVTQTDSTLVRVGQARGVLIP